MAKSLVLNRSRKVPAEDTAAFGPIAERFRRAGALERAVELCREGLQKFPDHISARVTLGWSLLDLGKYDDARVQLEQVLRRAPDNLAAIRGLAELHDRFEHTLHLPMDGPGQWPPPPEAVDEAGGHAEASATVQDAGDADLEMTPAALGIPIWSPAVSSTPEVEPPPVIRAAAVPAPVAASAVIAAPAPAAAAAPVAPAPLAASEPAAVEVSASGSGMSSVREIDFAPAEVAADEYAVSDPDIQALIAEAESLDAAAVTAPVDSEAVSLEAMAAETEDPLSAVAEIAPLAPAYTSVTEAISVDLDLDAAPPEVAEVALDVTAPAAESALEAEEVFEAALEVAAPIVDAALEVEQPAVAACASVEPDIEAALEAEQMFEAALEVAAPIVEAALEVQEPAPGAVLENEEPALGPELAKKEEPALGAVLASHEEPVVVAQAEPQVAPEPEVETAAAIDVNPTIEHAPEIDLVSEIDVAPAIEALAAAAVVELAPVAAAAEVVSIEMGRTVARSPVPALERFLTKVQARRAQLMAESVA